MADQIAVVTFTTPASTGVTNLAISGSITDTCNAAIFFWGGAADNATSNTAQSGIGFFAIDDGDSINENACAPTCQNGQTSVPATITGQSTANCIHILNPADGTQLVAAQFSAQISGGISLNFSTVSVQARVTVVLFAGLARAYTDTVVGSSLGGSEDTGGTTNFEPDLVVFASSDANLNTTQLDAAPNIGFAINDDSVSQICAYLNIANTNDPSDADGVLRSDDAYVHDNSGAPRPAGLNQWWNHVDQFTSSGFDHTAAAESGTPTPDAHYLAIKFTGHKRIACAHLSVAASTGDQTFTGFGFVPHTVIGMSTLMTSVDTETDGATASAWSYFVTGTHGTRGYTASHEEGITVSVATPANAKRRSEDAFVMLNHQGTVVQRATWNGGSGTTGFKLNFTVADAAGTLTAIAIGDFVQDETEEISETFVSTGAQTSVLNETVAIVDGAVLIAAMTSVFNETVQIAETYVTASNAMMTDSLPAGWTFAPGSERGTTLAAGAEAGTVLWS